MKGACDEIIPQRLDAQATQQLLCAGIGFIADMHDGAETARIIQAQHSQIGAHLEMVMHAGSWQLAREHQAARHAQVQQQQACVEVHQQVLAAPAHPQHLAPRQFSHIAAQWPAQGLAHAHRFDASARNAIGKAESGHFHFWQFGHVFSEG